MKKKWQIITATMLLILVAAPALVSARHVDCQDVLAAGETFKDQVIQREGGWGEFPSAWIQGCQEFTQGGKLLGFLLPVSPRGYILMNPLTQLEPVKAYSTESDLDVAEQGGFTKLLRDRMEKSRDFLEKAYGRLRDIPDHVQLAPTENRARWDRLQARLPEFIGETAGETGETAQPTMTVGPLLTCAWNQGAPYNNYCPLGANGARTYTGCVATAAAQIMKFWSYPQKGIGSHTYYWRGDVYCSGSPVGAGNLSADFSDTYDWANMLNSYGSYNSTQAAAVAELSYEVGVAFEMDYGTCGSGAYTDDAAWIFPTYFNYADTTELSFRWNYASAAAWFNQFKKESDATLPRPIQYKIDRHSIVSDGYQTNPDMVHMNYGWGGSASAWYSVDNFYCYWDANNLCPYSGEFMIAGIQPKNRLYLSFIGTDNTIYEGRWNHSLVDGLVVFPVDGGGSSTHAPAMTVYQNKQYLAAKGNTDNNIYLKSRSGMSPFADVSWTQVATGSTTASPALTTYNNRLYLFALTGPATALSYNSMQSTGTWSTWATVSASHTSWEAAPVVFNGKLYVFETDSIDNHVYFQSMDAAGAWSARSLVSGTTTDKAPAVVRYNDKLWLFIKDQTNGTLNYASSAAPESSWSSLTPLGQSTDARPSVEVVPEYNQLHLAVKASGSTAVFHRYVYLNGTTPTWSAAWESLTALNRRVIATAAPVLGTYYRYDDPPDEYQPNQVQADFNGDVKSDILWYNSSTGDLSIWLMNGATIAGGGSPGSVGAGSPWQIVDHGDFNGNGKSDILWRNSATGDVSIWLMNGTTFSGGGSPGSAPTTWQISGVGDFNGDGKSDILWRNSATGEVAIWFINGATISAFGSLGSVPAAWQIFGVGDFNGDGKSDILWRNTTTGDVSIWLMNGATISGGGSLGSVPTTWQIAGVGDFNGDGKSDILWRNTTTGDVSIWLMNGMTISAFGSLGSVPAAWQIFGVGDFNGDGKSDILWRNTTTGDVAIWFLNGATISAFGSLGSVPTTWQIKN
jgi:hypothetical protein